MYEAFFDKNDNTLPEIDLFAQISADYNNKKETISKMSPLRQAQSRPERTKGSPQF